MPEEMRRPNPRDPRGERSWTRSARGMVRNADDRNLPGQSAQAPDALSRRLSPQRSSARFAQRSPREREDQQARQNRLAGLSREREAVAVDQLPQAVRDQMTRGAENGRTTTGRHRQAERNQLARQYRSQDVSNLDNRLAHLQNGVPDRAAAAQSERSALAAKVRAAQDRMRAERPGPASARDMSSDGRAHTRNSRGPRDSRGPGNRADGHNRDRGDRSRNSPSLGRA